jgi:hypothetical protein
MRLFSWERWPTLSSLFRHEQWNVGVAYVPIQSFLTPEAPTKIEWMPAPRSGEYWADPFAMTYESHTYLLYELFDYATFRGSIHCTRLGEQMGADASNKILSPSFHTSYPFTFEHDGNVYFLPESKAANEVVLYRLEKFPNSWQRYCTLVSDFSAVDPTIVRHNGLWYLFCGGGAASRDHDLYVWYATDLAGPWKSHSGNPVKTGSRRSRPGGTIFTDNGSLYRPAQDGAETYGGRIVVYRINCLTPDSFEEEEAAIVSARPEWPYSDGLHTLSALGDMTFIDAKRYIFSFQGFRYQLKRRALKFGRRLSARLGHRYAVALLHHLLPTQMQKQHHE